MTEIDKELFVEMWNDAKEFKQLGPVLNKRWFYWQQSADELLNKTDNEAFLDAVGTFLVLGEVEELTRAIFFEVPVLSTSPFRPTETTDFMNIMNFCLRVQ